MKTIYRIETVDGRGLYSGLWNYTNKSILKGVDYRAFCHIRHHPCPDNGELEPELFNFIRSSTFNEFKKDYFFGFGDIGQLDTWLRHVSAEDLHNFLKSKLFVVIEFAVPEGDYKVFNYQAMFKKTNAKIMKRSYVDQFCNKNFLVIKNAS